MAQGGADFNGIVFRDGRDSEKQKKKYEALMNREISPTRYANDSCLRTLGLYANVYWMLGRLGLTYSYA